MKCVSYTVKYTSTPPSADVLFASCYDSLVHNTVLSHMWHLKALLLHPRPPLSVLKWIYVPQFPPKNIFSLTSSDVIYRRWLLFYLLGLWDICPGDLKKPRGRIQSKQRNASGKTSRSSSTRSRFTSVHLSASSSHISTPVELCSHRKSSGSILNRLCKSCVFFFFFCSAVAIIARYTWPATNSGMLADDPGF